MALAEKPLPLTPVAAAVAAPTPTTSRPATGSRRPGERAARHGRPRPRPHNQKQLSLRQLATDLGAADALALAPVG